MSGLTSNGPEIDLQSAYFGIETPETA